jgi:hypothetical protein
MHNESLSRGAAADVHANLLVVNSYLKDIECQGVLTGAIGQISLGDEFQLAGG